MNQRSNDEPAVDDPTPSPLDHWEFAGKELIGLELVDLEGHRIGVIREVFLDADTDLLEWVDVAIPADDTPGTFSVSEGSARFVPAVGVELRADGRAGSRWSLQQVLDSPVRAADLAITRNEEDELYAHYELGYPRQWINNGLPGGATMVGAAAVVTPGAGTPDGPG
jgi:hypothetical protein